MCAWCHTGQGGAGGRSPPATEVPPGLRLCMCADVTWRAAVHGLHAGCWGMRSPPRPQASSTPPAGSPHPPLGDLLVLSLYHRGRVARPAAAAGGSAAAAPWLVGPSVLLTPPATWRAPPPSTAPLSRRGPRPPPPAAAPARRRRPPLGPTTSAPLHVPACASERARVCPASGARTVALAHDSVVVHVSSRLPSESSSQLHT
jgi:hypothetical protein